MSKRDFKDQLSVLKYRVDNKKCAAICVRNLEVRNL